MLNSISSILPFAKVSVLIAAGKRSILDISLAVAYSGFTIRFDVIEIVFYKGKGLLNHIEKAILYES